MNKKEYKGDKLGEKLFWYLWCIRCIRRDGGMKNNILYVCKCVNNVKYKFRLIFVFDSYYWVIFFL